MSEVEFWSLPSLDSPFSPASFTVRAAAQELQLRWRHQHVACIGSYSVRTCSAGLCNTQIVNTENKRSLAGSENLLIIGVVMPGMM